MQKHHLLSLEVPTLFLLECVQMNLPESVSRNILTIITQTHHHPCLILYDPILLHDPFGKIMEQNLSKAGINDPDLSIWKTRILPYQIDKLLECGFRMATGCDMMSAYDTVLTVGDRGRANGCEMLDEVEEWILIMRHYCFVVAGAEAADDGAERFCSTCEGNLMGFVEGRCVSQRLSDANNAAV